MEPVRNNEVTILSPAVELGSGERVTFESGKHNGIVFGRNPDSEYEGKPLVITPDLLPVKLLETSNKDTSRQQFKIEMDATGYILTNYSKKPLHIDGVSSGDRDLAPNMATLLAHDASGMRNLGIGWLNHFKVSVVGFGSGSGDKNQQLTFAWNIK